VKNNLVCYEITKLISVPDGLDDQRLGYYYYIAVKDDGWYTVHEKDGAGFTDYQPPVCFLKPASKKAQSWDYDGRIVVTNASGKSTLRFKASYHQYLDSIDYDGRRVEATRVTSGEACGGASVKEPLSYHVWYLPGKGQIQQSLFGETLLTYAFSCDWSIKIGDVVLNKAEVEKEASSETVEALPGVVTEFKKSRTIIREVSYSTKLGLGADVEVKLTGDLLAVKGALTTKIRGSIEKEHGEKFTNSETREQTVRIDGDKIQKARIVWIDTYRTGTVQVTQDGQTYSIPFQFPLGTKLVIRKQ